MTRNIADRIASTRMLDRVAGPLRDLVQSVLKPGSLKDAAHGVWLGHPVHPALAQLPVGCFTAAALLDLTGTPGPAASRLIGFGLLGSAPAAATGLADYADSHEEQQRVGVVHAAVNSLALGCYTVSLALRRAGRDRAGVTAGLVGLVCAGLGATLGGDLAFRRAVGANHAAEVPHAGPEQWCDLGPVEDFAGSDLVPRTAGLIPVVVLRSGGELTVLHDRCSHLAAPLHQGELERHNDQDCVVCPWHGSVFRISNGAVVHGPATAPQPVLESRVHAGRLQTRVRAIPGVPAS